MSYVSASTPASSTAPTPRFKRAGPGGFYAVVSLLLGLLVGVLAFVAIFTWADAHDARKAADRAASRAGSTASMDTNMPGMNMGATAGTAGSLQSFAGAAPANATALAAAHKPYPATLPAAPSGVADVHLVLKDVTVQIAPGVKYSAWAWAGGAPGPVIHVRQGSS